MMLPKKALLPIAAISLVLTSCVSANPGISQEPKEDHLVKILERRNSDESDLNFKSDSLFLEYKFDSLFLEYEFELSDGRTVTCIEATQVGSNGIGEGLSCDWASAQKTSTE